jgi:hypothetical protein
MISLRTRGSSKWRKNITPSIVKNFLTKYKMDAIQSSLQLFQRGIFEELRETKGTRRFPEMSARTRFTLSSRSTYTLVGKGKNQQIVEMEIIKQS